MPEPFSATAPLKSVKGTSTKPGVTFTGDEDTGLYNSAPDELAVSLGGSEKAKFTGTGVDLDGDITLDDGGTYSTTLQMVTPTANRTISFPDATGTVALVAGSSGQFLYNNAGALAGSSTLIIDGDGNITQSGRLINTATGVASGPPVSLTGTWYSGGTSTTTKPQVLIEPSGTTSTAWSTSGTGLGVNAASGFSGRLLDLQVNGTSNFSVNSTGSVSVPLGSNTSPSVYFGTDVNSGLYSPGADQVAISTNGTEKLRIDDNGIVYFGNFDNTANAGYIQKNTSGDYSLDFVPTRSPSTDRDIRFFTKPSTEAVRITSDGKLGLGTSIPAATLEVNFTSQSPSGGGTRAGNVFFNAGGNVELAIGCDVSLSNRPIWFQGRYPSGGAFDSLRYDISLQPLGGNVGIGTTAPVEVLEVRGGTANVRIRSNDASSDCELRFMPRSASGTSNWNSSITGISTGALAFGVGASVNTDPTEALRIDSSGRLLVGTSSAFNTDDQALLQVSSIGNTSISLLRSDATIVADNPLGEFHFFADDASNPAEICASIIAKADGTHANGDRPTRLEFSTTADGASSPTERMRIKESGEIWFNTTTGTIDTSNYGVKLQSNGVIRLAANTIANQVVLQAFGSLGEFKVLGDGDCENTNNSYGAISDIKLKENIIDASSQWDDLKALQVRNYNFKPETGYNTHTQIGLIAQEVELVSPGLVSESPDLDEDGNDLGTVTKSVNYSVLYMKAVKALQEAMERIEVLEAKVNALEGN